MTSLFFSVEPQHPIVKLTAVSETSLSFTWNEYHHCNNDSVLVTYEFELRRNYDNTMVYDGKESNTKTSFNDLEPVMEYAFRMRVSLTDDRTGRSRFSSWSSPTHVVTLLASTKTQPTAGLDFF